MIDPRSPGFIYAMQKKEHIDQYIGDTDMQVIKIGRTHNIPKRMKEYPKGSILIACQFVSDMLRAENALKNACNARFNQRRDLGTEYFDCGLEELLVVAGSITRIFSVTWNDLKVIGKLVDFTGEEELTAPVIMPPVANAENDDKDPTLLLQQFVNSSLDSSESKSHDSFAFMKDLREFYVRNGCRSTPSYKSVVADLRQYYKVTQFPLFAFDDHQGPALVISTRHGTSQSTLASDLHDEQMEKDARIQREKDACLQREKDACQKLAEWLDARIIVTRVKTDYILLATVEGWRASFVMSNPSIDMGPAEFKKLTKAFLVGHVGVEFKTQAYIHGNKMNALFTGILHDVDADGIIPTAPVFEEERARDRLWDTRSHDWRY